MDDHHQTLETWTELDVRLSREWVDSRAELARAQNEINFKGWKPSADR